MLQSELKTLQELGDSLKHNNDHQPERVPVLSELKTRITNECDRVIEALTKAVFTPAKDNLIERYIQYHQTGIIALADQVPSQQGDEYGQELQSARRFFIAELFRLLNYIERFFSRYFNIDSKIPDSYRLIALNELDSPVLAAIHSIEAKIQSSSLKSCILDYLQSFSIEKFPAALNFRDLIYLKSFLHELEQVFEFREVKDWDLKVSMTLIYHNFNHLGFFAHCQESIRNELDSADSKEQYLHILSRSLTLIKNLQTKPSFSYHPGWPTVKSMLESWLGDEIAMAVLMSKNENNGMTLKTGPTEKLVMNLSVAQIACFIKMFYEEGCYGPANITDILKFTVKHFQSKRRQQISYGSLSKEYYSISQVTAAVVKDLLVRMSVRITKHYFPVIAVVCAAYCCSSGA